MQRAKFLGRLWSQHQIVQHGKSALAARSVGLSVRTTTQVAAEPFLNGTSSVYIEEMYAAWLEDPQAVHKVDREILPDCDQLIIDRFSLGTHFFVA